MSVDPQKVSENTGVHKKSKSKKIKATATITESTNGIEGDPHSEVTVEKKRKKRTRDPEVSEGDKVEADENQKNKRKKKRDPSDEGSESHTPLADHKKVDPSVEGSKDIKKREKKKKRTKTKDTDADKDDIPNHNTDRTTKKKPKKKKGESLHDPEEDESLDDQARKALTYVFEQAEKPSEWKFNKARQNWLIRNIWSPQAVPDQYFPHVVRYLSDSKGGVRDNLVKMCEAQTKPSDASSGSTPEGVIDPQNSPLAVDVKKDRAHKLLEALAQGS